MSDKKLNILFLSTWYPNRIFPRLGNFVQRHAEAVALKNNVISLHVCSDTNCLRTFEITETTINNVYTVTVYYKKVTNAIPVISNIAKAYRSIFAYYKGFQVVKKQFKKINLIHHNVLYPTGVIPWYLNKTKNIPYIITEHWTGYLPLKNTKIGWLQHIVSKQIAKNASCITPVSSDLRDAMISFGYKAKYEVIYNVFNPELFFPKVNKTKNEKVKIIHLSTLDDAHKNVSGILRVVQQLSKQRTDFEVWFMGGDIKPHVKLASELTILNTFAFFEEIKPMNEVAEMMRNADCFLLFSNYENLPCVLVEALASGIPIVSSSVGGIPEHITDNFGLLVKPKDEKALLDSLNLMIDNIKSSKYDTEVLSRYAKANFSYEKVGEKFDQLYRDII